MHTTQTTHHRIFATNLGGSVLDDVMADIGADFTGDAGVFDLVIAEGDDFSLDTVIRDMFPARLLPDTAETPWHVDLGVLAEKLGELCEQEGYKPQTGMFTRKYYEDGVQASCDISCIELMDLLMALAGNHYKIEGIYTQWAMHSDKAQFGAHAGGTRITTRHFSVPCFTPPDRAETVIKTLAKHKLCEVGDYFVNEFINPILDCVPEGPMQGAVERAAIRFMGGYRAPVSEGFLASVSEPADKSDVAGNEVPVFGGVPMEKTGKDWTVRDLDYYRNWNFRQVGILSGISVTEEDAIFYIDWFGLKLSDYLHNQLKLPADYVATVKDIRSRLLAGEELTIPNREHK